MLQEREKKNVIKAVFTLLVALILSAILSAIILSLGGPVSLLL
jgi:hypothetical protein